MLAPFAGVPGKLKTLIDRLTATRAANLDNLNATVGSRAVASTALLNTVWTSAKAAFLDVALSSRASQASLDTMAAAQILSAPPVQLIPRTVDGVTLESESQVSQTRSFGRKYSPSLTIGTWYTLINISGAGVLNWFSVYESHSTSKNVSIRITLDGVVCLDMASSGNISNNSGHVAVGFFNGSNYAVAPDFIPYISSLKIEVKSNVAGNLSCVYKGAVR